MISSIFMGAALCCAFFIQTSTSYAVGLWSALFMCGIISMLMDYSIERRNSVAVYSIYAWVAFILVHTFIITPVFHIYATSALSNGQIILYEQAFDTYSRVLTLLCCPLYFIALSKSHMKTINLHEDIIYLLLVLFAAYICFLEVIGFENVFNLFVWQGNDLQNIEKTLLATSSYDGQSGTLINRNNSATLINIGAMFALYRIFRGDLKKNIPIFTMFIMALMFTGSKAGLVCFSAAFTLVIYYKYKKIRPYLLGASCAVIMKIFMIEGAIDSLKTRFPIWQSSLNILEDNYMRGVGNGLFDLYYKQERIEYATSGMYAHNDYLQIAVEMGMPAIGFFLSTIFLIILTGLTRKNIFALAALSCVYIHALISFPLYIPAISMICGFLWFKVLYKH